MEKFEAFGFFEILVKALPKIKASPMVQEKRIKYLILLMENFSYLMQIKTKPLTDILYSRSDNQGREFISNLVELLLFEDEGVQIQVCYLKTNWANFVRSLSLLNCCLTLWTKKNSRFWPFYMMSFLLNCITLLRKWLSAKVSCFLPSNTLIFWFFVFTPTIQESDIIS